MKSKVYALIYEWVTEYDGDDVRVQTFRTRKEARETMRKEYLMWKRDYFDYWGRSMTQYECGKDSACIQVSGRYRERHDRWVIQEMEIDLTKENIIEI